MRIKVRGSQTYLKPDSSKSGYWIATEIPPEDGERWVEMEMLHKQKDGTPHPVLSGWYDPAFARFGLLRKV